MRAIDADAKVTVTIYDEEHEEHIRKEMTVEEMLDTYTDGCPEINGWITVCSPKANGFYLVTRHREGNIGFDVDDTEVKIQRWQNGHWVFPRHFPEWINDELNETVLAWQCLPEPYEEEV